MTQSPEIAGGAGFTYADGSGLTEGGVVRSNAFAFDLTRLGVFGQDDTLDLRLSQPLRVSGGALSLNLPVDYDYTSESAVFGIQRLSLSPEGREVMAELAWSGGLWGGNAGASLFWRREPGHVAAARDDAGLAVSWGVGF